MPARLLRAQTRLLLALMVLAVVQMACARADIPAPMPEVRPTDAVEPTRSSTELPTSAPADATQDPPMAAPTVTETPAAPEPVVSPTFPPTPTSQVGLSETILYQAQPGETVRALAIRFGVVPEEISSPGATIDGVNTLLDVDQLLLIPRRLANTGPSLKLIPDSEFVFSPHAADFDPEAAALRFGGFLTRYNEEVYGEWRSGPEVVALAARDNSVNPRFLMAMLEYVAGWVTRPDRPEGDAFLYPLGYKDPGTPGLYRQLTWLANAMGDGYYRWRSGSLTEVTLADGSRVRLAPELNAGTVAVQSYFASRRVLPDWEEAVGPNGFVRTYTDLFGDPWSFYHPLYQPGVEQPEMILPFTARKVWAFTGGPHGAWEREAAWAALDFAPSTTQSGCDVSPDWVVAASAGLVTRSEHGLLVLDLDGDGREETGWVMIYLHLAEEGRMPAGVLVEQGARLGHPSCEGGIATGSHVHIARKYNGEWILADGPLAFTLSGWQARSGTRPYQGALVRGTETVLACPCATAETLISR
ncbi:MAG TPA: hypothetical protein VLL77_10825 [Anaerolineales bacterium]|nr:hypothetical protein [Anaerolineales bacterium]